MHFTEVLGFAFPNFQKWVSHFLFFIFFQDSCIHNPHLLPKQSMEVLISKNFKYNDIKEDARLKI